MYKSSNEQPSSIIYFKLSSKNFEIVLISMSDKMYQTSQCQICCYSIKCGKIHPESGQVWILRIFHGRNGFSDKIK